MFRFLTWKDFFGITTIKRGEFESKPQKMCGYSPRLLAQRVKKIIIIKKLASCLWPGDENASPS